MTTFPAAMHQAGWKLVKTNSCFRWRKGNIYIKHGVTIAYWQEHGTLPPWCELGG